MVNAGRIACITTPFILSLLALATLVVIFMAGTIKGNSTLGDMYFLKVDLSNLTITDPSSLIGSAAAHSGVSTSSIAAVKKALGIQDYYTIYLRNYCAWSGSATYANCSTPQPYFWFNPLTVWNLNVPGLTQNVIPKDVQDGLKAYQAASKALFLLYAASLAATALVTVVGISAIFSRWGSFCTTIVAAIAGIAYIGAAAVMTAMFITLRNVMNKEFQQAYQITTSLGMNVEYLAWAGVAFAAGSSLFWLLSVCFCSGRSPYNRGDKEGRRTRAEKTPYTYERVGSPFQAEQQQFNPKGHSFQPQSYQMNTMHQSQIPQYGQRETAYEPFRSQQV